MTASDTIVSEPRRARRRTPRAGDLTTELIEQSVWSDDEVARAGIPVLDAPFVTVGGGLGSLAMASMLRIAGVGSERILVLGDGEDPAASYARLASNSQIPDQERLRSDAGSVMDNIWAFPSYALREAWEDRSLRPVVQVVTEPVLAEYFTPRAGQVFRSVARERERIGWHQMLTLGHVRMVRRRGEGGFLVLHTPAAATAETERVAYRTNFVHLAVGYAGVQLLPDLQAYRARTGDRARVVNAYEFHRHVYDELVRKPATVVVRGNGIVASRVLQRLIDDRDLHGAQTRIVHLFRNYASEPQGSKLTFRRPAAGGFAYQAFNYPKAAWGGQLRGRLARLEGPERAALIDAMGGTNTAPRRDWQRQLERGCRDGFYQQVIGTVTSCDRSPDGTSVVTTIRSAHGDMHTIEAQFVIDATGLEADVCQHRLLNDLLAHSGAQRNPKGRLDVDERFEVIGTSNGDGRMYASGAMTLGGPFAPVDSFLGLQYAALQIVDDLASRGFAKRIGPLRSLRQWWRWTRGGQP
jgi:hypothetical protein